MEIAGYGARSHLQLYKDAMRILAALQEPRTIDELASELGMHPRKVYRMLATLPVLGTRVDVEEEPRTGRGRPIRRYFALRMKSGSARTWLYQIAQWPQRTHVRVVSEGAVIKWPVGRKASREIPKNGDLVLLFRAPTGNRRFGICGWGKVIRGDDKTITFIVLSPSDQLKAEPWWSPRVKQLVDEIRGSVRVGTLWLVDRKEAQDLQAGLQASATV